MGHNKRSINNILKRLSSNSQSSNGREIIVFLIFLCIASIFWLLSNLNNEIEENIEIPIEIIEIPDSITILDDIPNNINVVLKEKGTSIIQYLWGKIPAIKIKFLDYTQGRNYSERFLLKKNDIEQHIKQYFGKGIHITSIQPDSIRINYTSSPCQKVSLNINTEVSSHFQYIINGDIVSNIDYLNVYKISDVDTSISVINTELIKCSDLKDTTIIKTRIKPINGFKIIPDEVIVTIPVEPLIAKKQSIKITSINVPDNIDLILFPPIVDITYLLPMSKYNSHNDIIINADYNSIYLNTETKIPLNIYNVPENYKNIEIIPNSVEYIIGQK